MFGPQVGRAGRKVSPPARETSCERRETAAGAATCRRRPPLPPGPGRAGPLCESNPGRESAAPTRPRPSETDGFLFFLKEIFLGSPCAFCRGGPQRGLLRCQDSQRASASLGVSSRSWSTSKKARLVGYK